MKTYTALSRTAVATALLCLGAAPLVAQGPGNGSGSDDRKYGLVTREELFEARMRSWGLDDPDPAPRSPTSRADSLAWERARRAAERATGRKIVVSLFDRRLWLIEDSDTLLTAPAGVGMGVVRIRGQRFDFSTPRGRRVVLAKEEDPLWVPPDWYYTTAALADGRRVAHLTRGRGVDVGEGRRLVVQGEDVGILHPDGTFEPHPVERAIVFNRTLYIPPIGTAHRRIPHVLGKYKLDLGEGYLIHGTTDGLSIGFPSTHGCIRLDAEDLERLYEAVEPGTPVYIY